MAPAAIAIAATIGIHVLRFIGFLPHFEFENFARPPRPAILKTQN
jgi:hypothetical protein